MPPTNYQRGITMWALLGLLILIGFVLLMAVRLIPAYLNYWSVISVAESIQTDSELQDRPIHEAWDKAETQFTLNNLRALEPRDIMSIYRENGSLVVEIDYEARRPLIANIDLMVAFERQVGP